MRDVPELLITGREREYFTWWVDFLLGPLHAMITQRENRFLKNEAYDPTSIDDDAIEEYVSKSSQPGGLRSIFNICKFPLPSENHPPLSF